MAYIYRGKQITKLNLTYIQLIFNATSMQQFRKQMHIKCNLVALVFSDSVDGDKIFVNEFLCQSHQFIYFFI